MKKILAVIDVQNDFITGKLANPDADKAVPNIVKKIEEFDGDMIICTFDTHYDWNYAKSKEGQAIPEHCIWGSDGWKLDERVENAIKGNKHHPYVQEVIKNTFGSVKMPEYIDGFVHDDEFEIEFVGFCTDICVVSNVLITKASFPNRANITVDSSCCAGLTPEKHEAALDVMRSCLIEVK